MNQAKSSFQSYRGFWPDSLCNIFSFRIQNLIYCPFIDFTEEDVEAILNMVFCACDEGDRDGVLSLDEFTSDVCEVCKTFLNFMYRVGHKFSDT